MLTHFSKILHMVERIYEGAGENLDDVLLWGFIVVLKLSNVCISIYPNDDYKPLLPHDAHDNTYNLYLYIM